MNTSKITQLILENGSIPQSVSEILLDEAVINKYKTLKNYLTEKSVQYDDVQLQQLRKTVEDDIYKQVFYVAHLLYYAMEQNNEWGQGGEQQVKVSFCRNLLHIPASENISHEQAQTFLTTVQETIETLGINALSAEEAKHRFNNFSITLFGVEFVIKPGTRITQILRFLGSRLRLMSRNYWLRFAYILADSKSVRLGEYDIHFFIKERIRTPNAAMANAATAISPTIYIREEALETIFYQKWVQVFEEAETVVYSDAYGSISYAIKRKALGLMGIIKKEDIAHKKEGFIKDIRENIVYHEIGHGVIEDHLCSVENVAIGEAVTRFFDIPGLEAMLEFLADFCPSVQDGTLFGPMHNIVQLSKTDPVRATRLFYIYFSDVWFYDTQDEYMYRYSDFICLIFLRYIKADQSIDFHKLEHDIQFHQHRAQNNTMFEKVLGLLWEETDHIRQMVKKAKFVIDRECDFKYLQGMWLYECQKVVPGITLQSPGFLSTFWRNMCSFIENHCADAPKIKAFLNKQDKQFVAKMMILSAGRKTAEEYNFDCRRYIVDRLTQLGLTHHSF